MPELSSGERIAVLISPELVGRLFADHDWARLLSLGAGTGLAAVGSRTEVVATGWDSPALTEEVLARAPDLRLIAHTGASIRAIVPRTVYDRGIAVSTVSHVLADGVAEYTIMAILAGLRRAVGFNERMHRGVPWEELAAEAPGGLLRARTVGVIGGSRVGRAVIGLLRAFGCTILLHDPFITDEQGRALGVAVVGLDHLLRHSDVVTLHAPLLPTTEGMLGAAELALVRDGALLVNTARAGLVTEAALLAELRSGRISAVLDVFHDEPLPTDSAWRGLENAVVTPHIAALTRETLHAQGRTLVEEIIRERGGQQLLGGVDRDLYDRMG